MGQFVPSAEVYGNADSWSQPNSRAMVTDSGINQLMQDVSLGKGIVWKWVRQQIFPIMMGYHFLYLPHVKEEVIIAPAANLPPRKRPVLIMKPTHESGVKKWKSHTYVELTFFFNHARSLSYFLTSQLNILLLQPV